MDDTSKGVTFSPVQFEALSFVLAAARDAASPGLKEDQREHARAALAYAIEKFEQVAMTLPVW